MEADQRRGSPRLSQLHIGASEPIGLAGWPGRKRDQARELLRGAGKAHKRKAASDADGF
jgi:hypothetical protein